MSALSGNQAEVIYYSESGQRMGSQPLPENETNDKIPVPYRSATPIRSFTIGGPREANGSAGYTIDDIIWQV